MDKEISVASKEGGIKKSGRVFIIFTAAFLGLLLIFGAVLGTVSIVKDARAIVKYKGIYLTPGVVNYLSATYKYDFMAALSMGGINCYDDESFWSETNPDGISYGEILKQNTEKYISQVVVGAYLFDRYTRLNKEDKKVISNSIDEVVDFRAQGDKDKFNEIAAAMGFDYSDFERAAQLLYKAEMAKTVIFGYDGESLKNSSFSAECEEYFVDNYSHVKLLIIRIDGEFVKDPETGKEVLSVYDENTKAKVVADIELIRTLINNRETESDDPAGWMDAEIFDSYISKYRTNTVNDTTGYYFSANSSYSYEFSEEAPEIVRLALSSRVGHYSEASLEYGVCFIYKYPVVTGAYKDSSIDHFFSDFYSNTAASLYSTMTSEYYSDVIFKDGYDNDAVINIPYNYELTINFN